MNIIKSNKGSANVLVCVMMVTIIGFTSMVLDVGLLTIEKSDITNAADAAALAGAQELPTNPDQAITVASNYCIDNGIDSNKINIDISEDGHEITVNVSSYVDFLFADVLGLDGTDITAESKAIVGSVSAVYDGLRPLGVEADDFHYGEEIILKEGGGDGDTGNYGGVALGGNGAKVFEYNLIYGYNGKISVGDEINTEPGNMAGAVSDVQDYLNEIDCSTFDNFDRSSERVWTLPIVNTMDVNGRETITIVGFAAFYVENTVVINGKTAEIHGRFIEFVVNGDIDPNQPDYGVKGVKLVPVEQQ